MRAGPNRGRSLRSAGSSDTSSSRSVHTRRRGPAASASRRLCACGSHLTQSQCGSAAGSVRTAIDQLVGRVERRRLDEQGPRLGPGMVLGTGDLDAGERVQRDRGREVGQDPVRRQQPVQGRRRHRVELVDGVGLRRLELQPEALRATGIPDEQPVVVAGRALPDPRALLGDRGERHRFGVDPGEVLALLGAGAAGEPANTAEVAEVLAAVARHLGGLAGAGPPDADPHEPQRGEQERPGGQVALDALAGHRHERDRADRTEHRHGGHEDVGHGPLTREQRWRRLELELAVGHGRRLDAPLALCRGRHSLRGGHGSPRSFGCYSSAGLDAA